MEFIMVLVAIAFVAGLPRSLWCIPAFMVMWGLSGGSSGGSDGSGNNIGYLLLPFVVLAVALWGVFMNIRRFSDKVASQGDDTDRTETCD